MMRLPLLLTLPRMVVPSTPFTPFMQLPLLLSLRCCAGFTSCSCRAAGAALSASPTTRESLSAWVGCRRVDGLPCSSAIRTDGLLRLFQSFEGPTASRSQCLGGLQVRPSCWWAFHHWPGAGCSTLLNRRIAASAPPAASQPLVPGRGAPHAVAGRLSSSGAAPLCKGRSFCTLQCTIMHCPDILMPCNALQGPVPCAAPSHERACRLSPRLCNQCHNLVKVPSLADLPWLQADLAAFRIPHGVFVKLHKGTWHAGGWLGILLLSMAT